MFNIFKKSLNKTVEAMKSIAPTSVEKIDKETLEDLLLEADISYELIEEVLEELPSKISKERLSEKLISVFPPKADLTIEQKPFVEVIIGINGAGKTTTISKLANLYKKEGKQVLLGASDTFRAAAIEQLSRWAEKLGVDIVATKQGHDASAVAYDTISKAVSKEYDNVIIDTAGRLHTEHNLGNELKKIIRVCDKALPDSPHRKILVLDGTQGSSAINQAIAFNDMVGLDGIIITKLDGTAKGGALLSIAQEIALPILYIGVGEGSDDLAVFEPQAFVEALLEGIYA